MRFFGDKQFLHGQERRDLIKGNRESIDRFKIDGTEKIARDGHYSVLNSSLESFTESFNRVIPEGDIRKYIEHILESRKGRAIGIEFGGVGENLFRDFSGGFFQKTFGVTLVDHRPKHEKRMGLRAYPTHQILVGDIFASETYKNLKSILGSMKVDFIIERMLGGMEFVPIEPYTVSKVLQEWYQLLSNGGIMLIQIPMVFDNLLLRWVRMLKEKYNDVLEVEYAQGLSDSNYGKDGVSVFRLRKLPNAPETLPLLDPRTIQRTSISPSDLL